MNAFNRTHGTLTIPERFPVWHSSVKVPRLTIYFWIIKILTTAMGESTSDFLVYRFGPFVAVGMGFVILVGALLLQFRTSRYVAPIYWLAALAVSIAGAMGADVLHVGFGVPYAISVTFYAVVLTVIFVMWYRSEKTLSIHSIYTGRRELFYWATVLATFALGMATGDLTAFTFKLGFFTSGILFAVIFAIPGLGCWRFGLNGIFAFWFAYIFTRPLGASFADWGAKPHGMGGMGWGDGPVSAVLSVLILLFVGYLAISRQDLEPG